MKKEEIKMKSVLKAGAAQVDISPKKGLQLAGYPHCPRPNEGVHDPLWAACLYLDNGKVKKAFVTADILAVGKQSVKLIRKQFPGIDITISASHTHSGPWASEVEALAYEKSEGTGYDKDYLAFFESAIIGIIKKAAGNTFDAQIGTDNTVCGAERGVGGNRHSKDGVCDPEAAVIAVRDGKGTVRAVLCGYALHPTYLHSDNFLVSADYPAYIRRYISFVYPEAIFLFAQGASGNQSSRYFRNGQNFEEAARAGTTLGTAVCDCIKGLRWDGNPEIKSESFELDLPMKKYPPIAEAAAFVKEREAKFEAAKATGDYIKTWNAELELFGAQNTYQFSIMSESGYVSPELPCEVQIISLGDTKIATFQGEIFVEYGLEIKKILGGKAFFFSVSNGYLPGYTYTPEAAKQKTYEAGTSMFAQNAGEVLIKGIKKNVKSDA